MPSDRICSSKNNLLFIQGGDQRAGPDGQHAAALRHADVVAVRRQDAPRARRQHRHEGCIVYRVSYQSADLGWVDFGPGSSALCPISLRQMGSAEQAGKMVDHLKSKSNQPTGPQADGTPCTTHNLMKLLK